MYSRFAEVRHERHDLVRTTNCRKSLGVAPQSFRQQLIISLVIGSSGLPKRKPNPAP